MLNCFRSYITYSSHRLLHFVRGVGSLSWCRRSSVRPPDDMEKSVAHRLHYAMPQSGNFAIQATSLFQSSLNLHFLFGASRFFTGGSAIAYPENVENSARNHPENADDYPIGIRHPRHAVRQYIHRSPTENLRPTFQRSNLEALG